MKRIISLIVIMLSPLVTYADYSSKLCETGEYKCIVAEPGQTWERLWPDRHIRKSIMHFNRTNKRLRPGMLVALPPANVDDFMILAPFEPQISPPGEKLILVNLKLLAWAAYSPEGILVNWGPASGGRQKCLDSAGSCKTVVGLFEVYDVRGENCVSKQYPINKGGAPMPYSMFFKDGYALHGSEELPGYNASHGCVRLLKSDARWLNEEFVSTPGKTQVLVLPYSK